MKTFLTFVAFGFLFLVANANAIKNPDYPRNHALTCGGVVILTEAYTTSSAFVHGYGRLVAGKDGELGEVTAVNGNQAMVLKKMQDAERGLLGFGSKKGFGLYQGGSYQLDLRNTVDVEEIFLRNMFTGQRVACQVQSDGDCC